MAKSKLVKRLGLAVALLLAGVAFFVTFSAYLYKAAPDFYRRAILTPEARDAAAQVAEQKLIAARNWAEHTQAIERARSRGATTDSIGGTTVSFSDDELNAFFQKWQAMVDWDSKYGKYLTGPSVAIEDGRLILAGTVTDLGSVVSLHFTPALDAKGQLQLKLEKVMTGRLTMPAAIWNSQKDVVTKALSKQLPDWQRDAHIDKGGAANKPAVSAAMTKLLLGVLRGDDSVDPVIFLPIDDRGSMPAKVSKVELADRRITLNVDPMGAAERQELLARIKEPLTAQQTAMGQ